MPTATQPQEHTSERTPPALRLVREPTAAAALLDPDRRRLVGALLKAPDSAAGLARRLGDSRQRLNYHLRALEDAGLVELATERRKGNFTERVLRVVGRRFVIDPGTLGELAADPEDAGDRFSATYLIALAARAIRELADLLDRAARRRKRLATAALEAEVRLARPADFEAFVSDLSRAVARVVARHHQASGPGRPFRVLAGAYPAPESGRGGPAPEPGGEAGIPEHTPTEEDG